MTSDVMSDLLYISDCVHLPEKQDIKRCYRTDFRLLTNKEAKKICTSKKGVFIDKEYKDNAFFVYNERKEELVPFKKNDYLMNEKEYLTYDGKKYLYFDNDGNLKECMLVAGDTCEYYDKKGNLLYTEDLIRYVEEQDAEELIKQENKKKPKK